ncbi:MAG: hypothetical protein EP346_00150 [Bacteroidetes bacterium]|nr:MAG: hypothetical protein EP346_00150 [Bacteroidota bacterium]
MKLLISDRISAYHRYVIAHEQLYNCSTPEQFTVVAGKLIEDFLENQLIHKELKHYNDTRTLLKEHPIFEEQEIRARIYSLTLPELVARRNASKKSLRAIKSKLKDSKATSAQKARREKIKWVREMEIQFIDERLNQTK